MDYKIMIQSTPNPNALKFVLNTSVKSEGNCTYKKTSDSGPNPMAMAIFDLNPAITEVYFFDNYVTVTQDGSADWDELEGNIRSTILEKIKDHDPNFAFEPPKKEFVAPPSKNNPDLIKINAILDETVRPYLQMDGGDIQVVNYENNKVQIFYQGACGSCPSATMGTLQAVENILKERFNPGLTVELADNF